MKCTLRTFWLFSMALHRNTDLAESGWCILLNYILFSWCIVLTATSHNTAIAAHAADTDVVLLQVSQGSEAFTVEQSTGIPAHMLVDVGELPELSRQAMQQSEQSLDALEASDDALIGMADLAASHMADAAAARHAMQLMVQLLEAGDATAALQPSSSLERQLVPEMQTQGHTSLQPLAEASQQTAVQIRPPKPSLGQSSGTQTPIQVRTVRAATVRTKQRSPRAGRTRLPLAEGTGSRSFCAMADCNHHFSVVGLVLSPIGAISPISTMPALDPFFRRLKYRNRQPHSQSSHWVPIISPRLPRLTEQLPTPLIWCSRGGPLLIPDADRNLESCPFLSKLSNQPPLMERPTFNREDLVHAADRKV